MGRAQPDVDLTPFFVKSDYTNKLNIREKIKVFDCKWIVKRLYVYNHNKLTKRVVWSRGENIYLLNQSLSIKNV